MISANILENEERAIASWFMERYKLLIDTLMVNNIKNREKSDRASCRLNYQIGWRSRTNPDKTLSPDKLLGVLKMSACFP